ncbi:MAG: sulfite exporter TauE/SafE family protein [Acetobacteraceae bacterium]
MIDPLYALSGLVVGVLIGLTGVGGGSLMTPVLIEVFRMHPVSAVGTDLLYATVTKSVGTAVHGLTGNVEWKIVGRLASGSVPATILTMVILGRFGIHNPGVAALISMVLAIALLLTAVTLLLKDTILRAAINRTPDFDGSTAVRLTIVVGFIVGVLVSLSSVGAGALGTTALMFLYPRLPMPKIVGSDIAHAVPLTLLAGLGHWWLGAIHLSVLGSLLVGSIPGVVIGSFASQFVPERALRSILALVLAVAGARMLG